ncbi:MAG: LamG domain-containing protein [Nibricoccus sp.]
MRLPSLFASCGLLLTAFTLGSALSFAASPPGEPGLLFYLSGNSATMPDFSAAGTREPNFLKDITLINDGARGPALSCGNNQLLSYLAPGNIYAQRGTLSFFWRSRYPVGPTPFPLFRVGYADHSSWDMVWLRIDYNGHGFDAFVTDTGLARLRVSTTLEPFPKPTEWIHLAFSWDETSGVRFYVNGHLAGSVEQRAFLDAGLDQFGPHSRVISPYQVQSDYNFVRGGDLDELRIYDRALSDDDVARLGKFETPLALKPLPVPTLSYDSPLPESWAARYGWNRPDGLPATLPGPFTAVRKVEITDAFDLKRWWWKACDGIRETTWPGVYNRSRLPGRNDYFQLPDWDCYVESGKVITFNLPAGETVNHLEIAGPAFGAFDLIGTAGKGSEAVRLFERPRGQEKTVHRLAAPVSSDAIRFTNVEQETPISEFTAYHVTEGKEPAGHPTLAYRIDFKPSTESSLKPLIAFIAGRFRADERATAIAIPASTPAAPGAVPPAAGLPILHLLIPNSASDPAYNLDKIDGALDGIALDLPVVGYARPVSFNIQVKDPIWPARNMLDFTYTVKPGRSPSTLWLDLRDRWLPPGRALYLTIAASEPIQPFGLAPTLRLVFKPKAEAVAEHATDRFTQVRDAYAMFVEERPGVKKYAMFNRIDGDVRDLMRVDPNHVPGLNYAAAWSDEFPQPAFKTPNPPSGVPVWAFNQVQLLERVDRFVEWYIDHRQVPYGDFGGGISDDTDLLNLWPPVALMGCAPEKIRTSLNALLDASFKNGMWKNGLSAIQTDELHSYEEGINCLGQNLILDYGNPKQVERAMATSLGMENLTAVNAAGHRHIRSSYYNGEKFATDEPWGWAKAYSHLVLQTPELLVDFSGNPRAKKLVLEVTDGLLAHRKKNAEGQFRIPTAIRFTTDEDVVATRGWFPWPLFWNSWQWTGDRKYLDPILDFGVQGLLSVNANALDLLNLREKWGSRILETKSSKGPDLRSDSATRKQSREALYRGSAGISHFAWQLTGDKGSLASLYENQCEDIAALEYINTEGSLWIDRVGVPTVELQRARLGGVALVRNSTFPGHAVSWRFETPATYKSAAILVPFSTQKHLTVLVYNLDDKPVRAAMTGWSIDPGTWEIAQGIDTNNDDKADDAVTTRTALFERSRSLDFIFPPRVTTVLTLDLKTLGTPYWQRPDLGLSREDVQINGREVRVKLHSLGSVAAPAATVAFRDASGKIVASIRAQPIAAPLDLQPKTDDVVLHLPDGCAPAGGSVEIDPDHELTEITLLNNAVKL